MALLLTYLLLALSCSHAAISKNESNILRLGKPQKKTIVIDEKPNLNASDYEATDNEKTASKERLPLIGFSKNNPELDWKNYLKMFEQKEDKAGELDVDFMNEKLEKTANSIQWLADLYDPLRWSRVPGKLRVDCRSDLEFFFKSLKDGKLWAAKSEYNRSASTIERSGNRAASTPINANPSLWN